MGQISVLVLVTWLALQPECLRFQCKKWSFFQQDFDCLHIISSSAP